MADINAGNIFYTVTIDRASLKRVEDEIVNLTQQLKRRGGDIGALSEEMTKFGARLDETVSSMKKMTEAASEAGVSAELMRDGAQTASGALDVYTQSAKEAKVSLERTAKANENAAVRIKRSQQATKQAAKASGDLAQRQANVSARLKEVVNNFKRTGQQAGVYVKKLTDLRAEQLLVLRALRKQRNETEKAGGDTTELTNRIASLEGQLAKTNGELSKHGTRLTKVGTAAERVKIGMAEMKAAATDLQTSFASGMGVDKAAREYANFMQRSRELERQLLKQREGLDKDSQAMAENTQRLAQLRAARQKATDSAFQHGIALEQSGMEVLEVTQRADRLASELEQLQAKFESGEINASQFAEAFNRLQGEVSETADDLNKLSVAAGRTDAETKQLEGSTTRLTRAERNASRQTRKLSARFEQMGRSQQLSYAASTLLNDQIFQMSPALGILTNSMIFTTDSFAAFARQAAPIVLIAGSIIGGFKGIVESIKAGIGLESALADVRKTTNLSQEGLEQLTQSFQTLSKEIPVSVDEFLEMARVAGQLGITGVENIERFATAVAKLGVATDVTGEQGAQALARFLQAVGTEAESMGAAAERVSNILNELENTTASTAAEILQMTSYTQGLSSAAGFTDDQILGLNAALLSLGVKAEAGGSAVVRTLDGIQQAATEGGDTLVRMAEVSGMTAERFSEVALASPVDAFAALTEGMSEAADEGDNLSQLLSEMEINEVRERRALLALSQGFDTLEASMRSAAEQALFQNSIQSEVEIMTGKVESQVELLRARFVELGQDIGTSLLPAVKATLDVLISLADNLNVLASAFVVASGAFATFLAVSNADKIRNFSLAIQNLRKVSLKGLTQSLRTATGAVSAFKISLGVIGIALTAAAGIFTFFALKTSDAEKEQRKLSDTIDDLDEKLASSAGEADALAKAYSDLDDVSGMSGLLGVITDLGGELEGKTLGLLKDWYEETIKTKDGQVELTEAVASLREEIVRIEKERLTIDVNEAERRLERLGELASVTRERVEKGIGGPTSELSAGLFEALFPEVSELDDFNRALFMAEVTTEEIFERFRKFGEDTGLGTQIELPSGVFVGGQSVGAFAEDVEDFREANDAFIDEIEDNVTRLNRAELDLEDSLLRLEAFDGTLDGSSGGAGGGGGGGGGGGDEFNIEEFQQQILNDFEAQEFDPRVGFDANAKAQFLYNQIISGIQSEISSGNISAEQGEAMANELIGNLSKELSEELGVSLADELDKVPDDIARIAGEKRRGDIGQAVADSVSQTLALEGLGEIGTVDAAQRIADSVSKAAQTMLSEGLISAEEYDQTVMQLIETLAGSNETVSDFAKSLVGGTEVPTAELAAARMEYEEAVAAARVSFESGFISEEEFLTQQRGALRAQIETVRGLDADASELVARYNQLGETINNVREGDALAEFFSNINNEIESALSEAEAAANLGVGEELSDVESRLIILDEATSGIISGVKAGQISPDEANGLLRKILQPFEDDFPGILEESQQELQQILDDELAGFDINQTLDDAISQALTLEEVGVVNIRDTAKNIADSVTQAARTMLFQGLISSEEYEQTIIELIENIEGADEELLGLVERRAGVAEISVPEVTVEEPGGSTRSQQQLDGLKELSDAREQYQETVAQANAEFEAGLITEEELLTRTRRALRVQMETIIALDGNVSDLIQQYKKLGEAIDNLPPPQEPPGKDEFEKATKGARNQTEALKELKEMYGDELPEGAEEFIDTFPDVDQAVVDTLDTIDIFAEGLSKAAGLINSETNPAFAFLANTVTGVASGLTENIGQTVKMFESLKEGGEGAGASVQFFAGILGNTLPEQTSEANKVLDAFATTVGSAIGSMFGSAEAGAAIGGLVSNLIGDISNAGKQIQETIDKVKKSSALLSRSLISSFADSATEVQSRGGFLGLLGFTKKVVNEEELQELVSIAEGFAGTISDAIRAGIDSKLAGNQDWKEDLEGTLKEGIRDALINSLIQAAVVAAEIEPFLEEVTRLIQEGSVEAAADYVEANYEDVVQEAIESSERVMAALPDSFFDEGPNFTEAGKFLGDSFGEALRESVKEQMGKLDEDIHNTAMDISNSVANSVANALMTGIKSYMMGDKDWEQALNDSITQSLIDAIVESFVNAAIIEGLMAEFLADFSTSVAKASQIEDDDERNAAYKQIFVDAGKDLDQIMKDANVIVKGFGEMAREAFGDQIAGMEGAGDFQGAGTQISEITGPTRDLLVDLLTPLSIIPTWTGLIQDIRNDVRSIARGRNILPSLPPREVQPIQMTQATTVSGGSVYNVNIGTIKTDSDNVRDLVSDISKFTYKERRGGKK